MKKQKIVQMSCPQCKTVHDTDPIIMVNPVTGEPRIEYHLPRECRVCGTGLQRMVTEAKTEKSSST